MPLFATMMYNLMVGLVAFLVQYMSKKLAVTVAAVAALSTITIALLATFNLAIAPLAAQVFATDAGQFIGLAFPPVAGTCMATMASIWAACTLYGWQLRALNIAVQS